MDTALLVIDMQRGFCDRRGLLARAGNALSGGDAAVAATAQLITAARAVGVRVLYTRHAYRPDLADVPARVLHDRPQAAHALVDGTWDTEILDELAPVESDTVIVKNRYDAFLRTGLADLLRTAGVERLIVAGVVTEVCVESTVRSAAERDYEVWVAADCTAGRPGASEPALSVMAAVFARVAPWRDLLPGSGVDRLRS